MINAVLYDSKTLDKLRNSIESLICIPLGNYSRSSLQKNEYDTSR